jgi:hypothetical protein
MSTLPDYKDIYFLLCEDARQEASGKFTLTGLYPGGDVKFANGSTDRIISSLAFFFLISAGDGDFQFSVKVTYPSGQVLDFGTGKVMKKPDVALTGIVKISPFHASESGEYKVDLNLDSKVFPYKFRVH